MTISGLSRALPGRKWQKKRTATSIVSEAERSIKGCSFHRLINFARTLECKPWQLLGHTPSSSQGFAELYLIYQDLNENGDGDRLPAVARGLQDSYRTKGRNDGLFKYEHESHRLPRERKKQKRRDAHNKCVVANDIRQEIEGLKKGIETLEKTIEKNFSNTAGRALR